MNENNLQASLQQRPLKPVHKGLGALPAHARLGQTGELGWRLLDEQVSLPAAVLSQSRLTHNLAWMAEFIQRYQLKLAPHGKTTMSPALFHRQLAAGAWGITLATAPQVRAAYEFGVRRVILANQLVGRANMQIIAELLANPDFECFALVDCPLNATQLGRFFSERGLRLPVLVELGVAGGRGGVRDQQQLEALLEEIAHWPQGISLAGVEVYEGVLNDEAGIRAFLHRARQCFIQLNERGLLSYPRPLLTGAGSAWFDLVAEEWADLELGKPVDVVLRPGCYLTHDVGLYRSAAERINASNPVARAMNSGLQPALQVWAYITSMPEPGLAILGLGKRDVAFDSGLPIPALHFRPGVMSQPIPAPTSAPEQWQLTRIMDQHAFMRIPLQADMRADLQVGDMLALDISHPCLTFDKWRQLLVVDDDYQVVELVETFF